MTNTNNWRISWPYVPVSDIFLNHKNYFWITNYGFLHDTLYYTHALTQYVHICMDTPVLIQHVHICVDSCTHQCTHTMYAPVLTHHVHTCWDNMYTAVQIHLCWHTMYTTVLTHHVHTVCTHLCWHMYTSVWTQSIYYKSQLKCIL